VEFEAGRLREAATEPSQQGDAWRSGFRTETGETKLLTDHAGRECLYHNLDYLTEVGKDIGFKSVRV
jgi:hypothetical protein